MDALVESLSAMLCAHPCWTASAHDTLRWLGLDILHRRQLLQQRARILAITKVKNCIEHQSSILTGVVVVHNFSISTLATLDSCAFFAFDSGGIVEHYPDAAHFTQQVSTRISSSRPLNNLFDTLEVFSRASSNHGLAIFLCIFAARLPSPLVPCPQY